MKVKAVLQNKVSCIKNSRNTRLGWPTAEAGISAVFHADSSFLLIFSMMVLSAVHRKAAVS
jgi:hypothetical protein